MTVLRIRQRFFDLVRSGKKTLEVRVGYPSIRRLTAGQRIRLATGAASCDVTIKAVRQYRNFADMLRQEDSDRILPDSPNAVPKLLRSIYPPHKEAMGVIVLEINPADGRLACRSDSGAVPRGEMNPPAGSSQRHALPEDDGVRDVPDALYDCDTAMWPDWPRLTRWGTKARCYERCTYFREAWSDVVNIGVTEADLLPFGSILVKPEVFVLDRWPSLLTALTANRFRMVRAASVTLDRLTSREIWRLGYDGVGLRKVRLLDDAFSLGPCVWIFVRDATASRIPATVRLTEAKGPRIPSLRSPSSLRTALGFESRTLTGIHVPDEPADLVREIGVLFEHNVRRAILTIVRATANQLHNQPDDFHNDEAAGIADGIQQWYNSTMKTRRDRWDSVWARANQVSDDRPQMPTMSMLKS